MGFVLITLVVCAALVVPGCASKHVDEEVWIPDPKVHWHEIAACPVTEVHNEYVITLREPTKGLFPASLGVTRLAAEPMPDLPDAKKLHLSADPRNEFLVWNCAFDDLFALSESFPISQCDLGGYEATPEQILAALHALHAGLGLVYAVNEISEQEAEMIGVLYDARTPSLVACVHASARTIVPEEGEEDPEPWRNDCRALVRAKFTRLVHACVRDLIARDQAVMTDPPPGWTPAGPIQPALWPPRLEASFR